MAAASRSLATALWGARFASGLLPPSYTTRRDTTRGVGAPPVWRAPRFLWFIAPPLWWSADPVELPAAPTVFRRRHF